VVNFGAEPGAPNEKIEMLGNGQQVVVASIHHDNGRPYSWHSGSL
jgi:hypothetical protein